jgi:hypothetical protein
VLGRGRLGAPSLSPAGRYWCTVPIYRLHDTTGDDLGLLEHPAPNLEPGDVVVVADGREAVVTARVEAGPGWGQLVAMLKVAIAPSRLEADDALP